MKIRKESGPWPLEVLSRHPASLCRISLFEMRPKLCCFTPKHSGPKCSIVHLRQPAPANSIHLKIWDSLVQVSTEEPAQRREKMEGSLLASPETLSGSTCVFQVGVADVDAAFKRAVDHGADSALPPTEMFWGDRYGWVRDPFGHVWALQGQRSAHTGRSRTALARICCTDERTGPMKMISRIIPLLLCALPVAAQSTSSSPTEPWKALASCRAPGKRRPLEAKVFQRRAPIPSEPNWGDHHPCTSQRERRRMQGTGKLRLRPSRFALHLSRHTGAVA